MSKTLNKNYKNAITTLSIIKSTTLLYIMFMILNKTHIGEDILKKMSEYDFVMLTICIIIPAILVFSIWLLFNIFVSIEKYHDITIILCDYFFIISLTILIVLSTAYESQLDYLYSLSIISSTIGIGKKRGIIMSIVSSIIVLSLDLIFINISTVNTYFENDIMLCAVFIVVAWILGEYVKYEKEQRRLLELELQLLRTKREVVETKELLSETKEQNVFITEFFTNISHELKTPLNIIFSSLQMLNMYNHNDNNLIPKRKEYIHVMKQNCNRLIRLINNLLDITKLDGGFITPQFKNADIIPVVEDITMSIVDYAKSKGVSIIFDTEIEEKIIAFDVDKIEKIMLNLLSNALKFTDEGGEIFVNITENIDNISISVKDSGIGIPEDKKELIFNRFMQVDKSLHRNNEGTGIGLSLVKSFVDMHGGTISLESELNIGSEFIITLPSTQINNVEQELEEIKNDITERVSVELSDIYLNM